MPNNPFHNQYRTGNALSLSERLKVRRTAKGRIYPDCCKILTAIFLLFLVLNAYAAEPEDLAVKEKQLQPAKQAGTRQGQQAVVEGSEQGKNKEKGVFIPSEKVSSDIPVSFPADI